MLNYTNPAPSGHRKPRETQPKLKEKKTSTTISLGAFLLPFLVPPVFQTKKEISIYALKGDPAAIAARPLPWRLTPLVVDKIAPSGVDAPLHQKGSKQH